jgi:hypothetical protein
MKYLKNANLSYGKSPTIMDQVGVPFHAQLSNFRIILRSSMLHGKPKTFTAFCPPLECEMLSLTELLPRYREFCVAGIKDLEHCFSLSYTQPWQGPLMTAMAS